MIGADSGRAHLLNCNIFEAMTIRREVLKNLGLNRCVLCVIIDLRGCILQAGARDNGTRSIDKVPGIDVINRAAGVWE